MPLYRYTARRPDGSQTREETVADSPKALRDALRRSGWSPTRVRELRAVGDPHTGDTSLLGAWVTRWKRHRRRTECAAFFDGVGTLLAIGMPLVDALASLGESVDRRSLRRLCTHIAEHIREGDRLSAAMHIAPDWFDAIDTSVIRSAERSGELAKACAELADRHTSRDELGNKLVAALSYPCVLVLLGLGVATFLSTYTLPKIVGVLRENETPIPGSTELLLAVAGFIAAHPLVSVLAVITLVLGVLFLAFSDRAETLRWRIPILGTVLRESALARVATQIGWLVETGVPLHEAIGLAAESSSSPTIFNALERARRMLADGVSITDAVRETGVFGGVFVHAVALGDESGEITTILHRLGERYRRSALRTLDRLTSVLEPGAIIAIACIIGFVAYASIMPMLRVSETMY